MKKRIIAILLFQILSFSLLSGHIGLTKSHVAPGFNLDRLQCGYDPRIDVIPALPMMTDPISITASGIWPDSCKPEYQSHQVTGNYIRLDGTVNISPGTMCSLVLLPWQFSVNVGTLPTGSYQIDLYITNPRYPQVSVLCARESFVVVEQLYKVYLPVTTK